MEDTAMLGSYLIEVSDKPVGNPEAVFKPNENRSGSKVNTENLDSCSKNFSCSKLPQISPDSALRFDYSNQVMEFALDQSKKGVEVIDPNVQKILCASFTSVAVKKSLKRKRPFADEYFIGDKEAKLAFIAAFRQELDGLFKYFKEVALQKQHLGGDTSVDGRTGCSNSSFVACLLEESNLPFSKLVEQIFEKLKRKGYGGQDEITLASVRSSVLFVGQRSLYGIANSDADVLEDDSESCLWCWETRDLKLLPKSQRGILNIRRICRKKIHERIVAVSAMVSSLSASEGQPNHKVDVMKAAEKLGKVLNEEQIRTFIETLLQKNDAQMVEKVAKLKAKELIKEAERNKRNAEKEKKRMDRELKKEKRQNEKELKRQQDEAEKEERCRKKKCELEKLIKRQQDDAEKDQRRREKEEAELKKQVAIQKQATIMERFLNSKKQNSDIHDNLPSTKVVVPDFPGQDDVKSNAIVLAMDSALSQKDSMGASDLLKLHLAAWRCSSHSACCSRSRSWGHRRNPKVVVIKELKLQGSSSEAEPSGKGTPPPNRRHGCSDMNDISDFSLEKLADGYGESVSDDRSCHNNVDNGLMDVCLHNRTKKLLQFDKSYRPAYYGTLSKKSDVVAPRHPFRKDPNLDYDIESDEEWEEEDPGESLSDCDKDDEEENLEGEGNPKTEDEDESEDSFLVPDGYLSENEGVNVDSPESDAEDEANSSPSWKHESESEEFKTLLRQQKYLQNLTEHALRKNQTLIILNLTHAKASLMLADDLSGTPKLEQICLQALSIRPCIGGATIDLLTDSNTVDDQEIGKSQNRSCIITPAVAAAVLSDSDLPEVVWTIRSCSFGINKVVESLQRKFPSVSKMQLKNKVREISDFVDNRWQVKKEILEKLGLSVTPERSRSRMKGIPTFFSKRCLPPEGEAINTVEFCSPQCRKP